MNQFLIELARDGDASATRIVVESLRPRLSRMAAYYAGRSCEDPDDLLQEAWIGLLEALPDLDLQIGSPEQHLIQRAKWRMLDAIKRARVRQCSPLDDEIADSSLAASDRAIDTAFVSEFVTRLSPTQRAVFDCLIDGLTWREAGDVMGCTSANIAYHVRQIRREYDRWNEQTTPPRQPVGMARDRDLAAMAAQSI